MKQQLKVEVWIWRRNSEGALEILLLKTNERRGAFWQPVTGSVEKDEDLESAAMREAIEETGLEFKNRASALGRSFEFEARGRTVREHGFEWEAPAGQASPAEMTNSVVLDPHEHQDFCWVSPEEALKLVRFEENAVMLSALLDKLSTR